MNDPTLLYIIVLFILLITGLYLTSISSLLMDDSPTISSGVTSGRKEKKKTKGS